MYRLAILDDEAAWAEDFRCRIMRHPLGHIHVCHSADELTELCNEQHIDVLVADICLDSSCGAQGVSGIHAVSNLGLQSQGTQIVYVTGMDGMYSRVRIPLPFFLCADLFFAEGSCPVRHDRRYRMFEAAMTRRGVFGAMLAMAGLGCGSHSAKP